MAEDLVKKLHSLQGADVEELRRIEKRKDKVVEEVIQNKKDAERNHPESFTERNSNLNESAQRDSRSYQEHMRNPVYEAELKEIRTEMSKSKRMLEKVDGKQTEILNTLTSLFNKLPESQ